MGGKKPSSNTGSAVLFVLALAAIGAALKFFQENWPIVAVIGGVLLLLLIIRFASKRKAQFDAKKKNEELKENARKRIEEEKRREEERKKEAERIIMQREKEISDAIAKNPGSASYRLDKMQTEVNASLLTITEFKAEAKSGFVVFDTETTGLSSGDDEIVEIGAVRVVNNEIVSEYHTLIDPCRPMPAEASWVNHITDDMLFGQPKIYEALPGFLSFVNNSVLVAHNARFDAQFIAQACIRNRFKAPERYFDTMNFARYFPEAANKKQATLLACAGIPNDQAHRALSDAKALAQFVIVCLNRKRNTKKTESPQDADTE